MSDKDNKRDFSEAEEVLELYRALIRNAIVMRQTQLVPNSKPSHAKIILEEMAGHSNRTFYAIASRLADDVWDSSVISAVSSAIDRNVDVRLLVENQCEQLHKLPDNVRERVRKIPDSIRFDFNIAIMDGRSFRIELDKQARKAVFCANSSALSDSIDKANRRLRELYELSKPC